MITSRFSFYVRWPLWSNLHLIISCSIGEQPPLSELKITLVAYQWNGLIARGITAYNPDPDLLLQWWCSRHERESRIGETLGNHFFADELLDSLQCRDISKYFCIGAEWDGPGLTQSLHTGEKLRRDMLKWAVLFLLERSDKRTQISVTCLHNSL